MQYYVYILRCSDGSLYTGVTNDLEKRVEQHNGLKPGGAKYTRSHRPVVLVHTEEHSSKPNALKREMEIKAMTRDEKTELMELTPKQKVST